MAGMADTDRTQYISSEALPLFPGVELDGLLAEGGMGRVYWGTQQPLGRPIALKVLAEHLVGDDSSREQFQREFQTLGALDHPNIVRTYSAGFSVDGRPFLVMELITGSTLREYIQNNGPMSPKVALAVAAEILAGLTHAHEQGILHLDIKPENVLLKPIKENLTIPDFPYAPKLADFGLASLISNPVGGTSTAGTPVYMAPEQHQDVRRCSIRSDYFSLGVCILHMMLGHEPFQAGSSEDLVAQKRKIQPSRLLGAAASPALAHALDSMLSFAPSGRPASGRQAMELLHKALSSASEKTTKKIPSRTLYLGGVVTISMLVAVLLFSRVYTKSVEKIEIALPKNTILTTLEKRVQLEQAVVYPMALFGNEFEDRINGWTKESGVWGPQEDGLGVIGFGPPNVVASIRRELPPIPWKLSGSFTTTGSGPQTGQEAIVALVAEDGSRLELRLQDLQAVKLLHLQEISPDGNSLQSKTSTLGNPIATLSVIAIPGQLSVYIDSQQVVLQDPIVPVSIELRAPAGPALFYDFILNSP